MSEKEETLTKGEVKKALNIKDGNKDDQIETLIPIVYEHIKSYCNIKEVPSEYDINAIKMIEYHMTHKPGVAGESLSRHSINFVMSYPPNVTRGLRRRLRW